MVMQKTTLIIRWAIIHSLVVATCICISACVTPITRTSDESSIKQTEQISYNGVNECGGMRNEVSFFYDKDRSTISQFKFRGTCIKTGSGSGFVPIPSIKVKSDGSFMFNDGRYVKGKILGNGLAEGDASSPFIPNCGDGSSRCTTWKAETQPPNKGN
jgi:hypothetical protein